MSGTNAETLLLAAEAGLDSSLNAMRELVRELAEEGNDFILSTSGSTVARMHDLLDELRCQRAHVGRLRR